jgi:hypothetical protein
MTGMGTGEIKLKHRVPRLRIVLRTILSLGMTVLKWYDALLSTESDHQHMCHLERSGASACGRAAQSRDLVVIVRTTERKVPRLASVSRGETLISLGMTVVN